MFNYVDGYLISILKKEFDTVEVQKENVFLSIKKTPMNYDWFVHIPHHGDTERFLDALYDYTRHYELRSEYKRMRSEYCPGALPSFAKLKPLLLWKQDKLIKCSNLLERLYRQKNVVEWAKHKKLLNQIPDNVVEFLNENDISVFSLDEVESYKDINEKFTRVWLKCFGSEGGYCITFMFNDTYVPENCNYRRYAFNAQFYNSINTQFGLDLSDLSMMYIKDKTAAVATLKTVAMRRETLNEISKILDRFYEESNDERKVS